MLGLKVRGGVINELESLLSGCLLFRGEDRHLSNCDTCQHSQRSRKGINQIAGNAKMNTSIWTGDMGKVSGKNGPGGRK